MTQTGGTQSPSLLYGMYGFLSAGLGVLVRDLGGLDDVGEQRERTVAPAVVLDLVDRVLLQEPEGVRRTEPGSVDDVVLDAEGAIEGVDTVLVAVIGADRVLVTDHRGDRVSLLVAAEDGHADEQDEHADHHDVQQGPSERFVHVFSVR